MKLRVRGRALADIQEIYDYIAQVSPYGAANVLREIHSAIRLIGRYPYGSQKTSDSQIRMRFTMRFPFKIFYEINDDTIQILHIRHTSRRPWI